MANACSIPGCDGIYQAKGFCRKHYSRVQKHGTPNWRRASKQERLMSKVASNGECWEWTGSVNSKGYPHFYDGEAKVMRSAHRVSYEMANGPIPEGMEVDHICRTRGCVNPKHLRLATRKQNMENLSRSARRTESGLRGVTRTSRGKWCARVGHNGRLIHVGVFDTMEAAADAAVAKRLELHTFNATDRLAS